MKKNCLICGCESAEELCSFCRDAVDAYWQEEFQSALSEEILEGADEEKEVPDEMPELRRLLVADTTGLADTVSAWLAENE